MNRALILVTALFLFACGTSHRLNRELAAAEQQFKDNTGFMLYDPVAKKTLAEYNAAAYFTPASNTKILTLFTSLHILGDSVPALRYTIKNDSLIFCGTGDPSFLNKYVLDNGRVYRFLQNSPQRLFVTTANFKTDALGPGWAWDDYPYSYSAERSPLPVYGNLETVKLEGRHFRWTSGLFQNHFVVGDSVGGEPRLIREIDSNQITFSPGKKTSPSPEWEIPFHTSTDVLVEMLSDTLLRQVDELTIPVKGLTKSMFSIPTDSLYAPMMKNSDNFIAEQLLLLCAQQLSDTLDTEIAIRYAQKNLMNTLPDKMAWVDGSGLSRFNLNTPRNIVRIWETLLKEIPRERLFSLLATGGEKGTLKNYYVAKPPFIFGKTGSLSNNLALSGYLITKKKKVLIFCFMNGNFVAPAREIRGTMERILTSIRDNY